MSRTWPQIRGSRPPLLTRNRSCDTAWVCQGHFVLNVGGMDARKHLAGLIQAFAAVYRQLENPDLRLFIVGDPDRLGSAAMFPDWRPLAREVGDQRSHPLRASRGRRPCDTVQRGGLLRLHLTLRGIWPDAAGGDGLWRARRLLE